MKNLGVYIVTLITLILFTTPPLCLAEEPLKLGVHPYLSASELYKRFKPLADYLSEKIGRDITVEISKNYQEHIDRIGKDELDIAYMGPAPYVNLTDIYGQKPILAVLEIKGKTTFQGVIIAHESSPVEKLSDLIGGSFAFGDPKSTMSHIVPRYMLKKAGVTVDLLKTHEFLHSHDNVALGVLMKDFDAGAVKEEAYWKYRERGLKALAFSPKISEHLFVASAKLPEEQVEAIREAMLGISGVKGGADILSSIKSTVTALVEAEDKDYDNLREIFANYK